MRFLMMVLVNCKRYFKNYLNVILMFLLPIICVVFINCAMNNSQSGLDIKVAIVNEDKGKMGIELANKLNAPEIYKSMGKAMDELKSNSIIAIYEIPENFTETIESGKKPAINSYKLEKGNKTQIFEAQIESKINDMSEFQILKNKGIVSNEKELDKNVIDVKYNSKKGLMDTEAFMPIVLIMFFLMAFSSNFTTDLLNLRKEKILQRFLSTDNKGFAIMGSIYLSMFITQIVMYTSSFIVLDVLFKYNFQNFGFLLLNIALMSLVSISMSIMITRFFKDASAANVVNMLISMVMFFVYTASMMTSSGSNDTKTSIINKLNPFYWCFDSIQKSKVFPDVFILILIALVFFTAGNIRYSNFAKQD